MDQKRGGRQAIASLVKGACRMGGNNIGNELTQSVEHDRPPQ